MKWGWELRLLRHFAGILGCRGCRARVPRGHFLCAGIANAPNIVGKGRPFLTQSHPKLRLGAQGAPKGPTGIPREPKGGQSDPKESPLGAQGAPKGPTSIPREPKGGQGHPKESKMSLKTFKGEQQITKLYTHKQNIRKLPIHRHTAAGYYLIHK